MQHFNTPLVRIDEEGNSHEVSGSPAFEELYRELSFDFCESLNKKAFLINKGNEVTEKKSNSKITPEESQLLEDFIAMLQQNLDSLSDIACTVNPVASNPYLKDTETDSGEVRKFETKSPARSFEKVPLQEVKEHYALVFESNGFTMEENEGFWNVLTFKRENPDMEIVFSEELTLESPSTNVYASVFVRDINPNKIPFLNPYFGKSGGEEYIPEYSKEDKIKITKAEQIMSNLNQILGTAIELNTEEPPLQIPELDDTFIYPVKPTFYPKAMEEEWYFHTFPSSHKESDTAQDDDNHRYMDWNGDGKSDSRISSWEDYTYFLTQVEK